MIIYCSFVWDCCDTLAPGQEILVCIVGRHPSTRPTTNDHDSASEGNSNTPGDTKRPGISTTSVTNPATGGTEGGSDGAVASHSSGRHTPPPDLLHMCVNLAWEKGPMYIAKGVHSTSPIGEELKLRLVGLIYEWSK